MSKAGGVFLCLPRAVNFILPFPGAELHVSLRVLDLAVVSAQVSPAVGSKCLKTLECSAVSALVYVFWEGETVWWRLIVFLTAAVSLSFSSVRVGAERERTALSAEEQAPALGRFGPARLG